MAYTTINDPSEYFSTVLYTGTATNSRPVIGTGFQPDWIWIKQRNATKNHNIWDSSRGVTKQLRANLTNAEATNTTNDNLASLDSDGFTLGDDTDSVGVNERGQTYVAWNWKANGGTTTTNDASSTGVGTIDSVYQANTTAGFSIVTYTGTNAAGTIAHGLGAVTDWIITKNRVSANSWAIYHSANTSAPETDFLLLNTDAATVDNANRWNDVAPTSTVFSVKQSAETNNSDNSDTFVAYCFTEIQGYSKFGKYVGNANADGPFIYTGFKPAWMIIKRTDSANSWYLVDITRDSANIADHELEANNTGAEATGTDRLDILSNGFKIRTSGAAYNADDGTYIYIAFAESPFVTSNGGPNNAQ